MQAVTEWNVYFSIRCIFPHEGSLMPQFIQFCSILPDAKVHSDLLISHWSCSISSCWLLHSVDKSTMHRITFHSVQYSDAGHVYHIQSQMKWTHDTLAPWFLWWWGQSLTNLLTSSDLKMQKCTEKKPISM